jgi:hypothetical protein
MLIDGFVPAGGDVFHGAHGNSRSGTFATVTGPLTAQYNPTNVSSSRRVSTVFTWDAGAGADTSWFNPLNWSPDGVPGAADTAILNISKTIDLSTADATVANFQQVTGTLTGTKTLTVLSSFTWSGGTESGTGATTLPSGSTSALSGALSLSGRTINNSGTVSLSGTGNVSASNGPSFHNLAGGIVDLQSDAGFVFGGPGGISYSTTWARCAKPGAPARVRSYRLSTPAQFSRNQARWVLCNSRRPPEVRCSAAERSVEELRSLSKAAS